MYHKLLRNNINSWGKVEYNIPLRISDNETRTSYSVGHRHIPAICMTFDCLQCDKGPYPELDVQRRTNLLKSTYQTTYQRHVNFFKTKRPLRTYDAPGKVHKVNYMCAVDSMLTKKPIGPGRELLSTCHASYQTPCPMEIPHCPSPGDFVSSNAMPSKGSSDTKVAVGTRGLSRHLDPYLSSYDFHYGIAPERPPPEPTSNTVTYYTATGAVKQTPGMVPKIGMSLPKAIKKERLDRFVRKKSAWTKNGLTTEMGRSYTEPLVASTLVTKLRRVAGVHWDPNPTADKGLGIF